MKTNWKTYKIKDIAEVVMGQSPPSSTYNQKKIGLPFYQGIVDFGRRFVDERVYCSKPKKIIDENYVLLSVRAPVGTVNLTKGECAIGRGNAGLRMKNGEKLFLFYLLKHYEKNFHSNSEGTVFSSINKSTIENLQIEIPPLSEQKAIAEVLSSLDDKIDLLHRQNKTLEQMAETLFRQWFVEEAKEDWEKGKLGDIIELNYGKGLKKDVRTGYGFPVVGSNGIVGYHSKYYVKAPGIVIGRKGTLGKVIYLWNNFYPIDTTYYVTPKQKSETLLFEYFILKTLSFEDMNSDSAVPGLNRDIALSTEVIVPPDKQRKMFNELIKPNFDKINKNTIQIHTLEKLRDTLLPKLMSGEVRVRFEDIKGKTV